MFFFFPQVFRFAKFSLGIHLHAKVRIISREKLRHKEQSRQMHIFAHLHVNKLQGTLMELPATTFLLLTGGELPAAADNCRAIRQMRSGWGGSQHRTQNWTELLVSTDFPDTWPNAKSAHQLSPPATMKLFLNTQPKNKPRQSVRLEVPPIVWDKEPPSLNLC